MPYQNTQGIPGMTDLIQCVVFDKDPIYFTQANEVIWGTWKLTAVKIIKGWLTCTSKL